MCIYIYLAGYIYIILVPQLIYIVVKLTWHAIDYLLK